jgi:hypothetical protein
MLIADFFLWWYSDGWLQTIHDVKKRSVKSLRIFSITTLLTTLFSPWKRIISYPGTSLSARLGAVVDNILSRCIGFVVRVATLIFALVVLVFVFIFSSLFIVIWPLLPIAVVVAVIKGVIG